MSPVPFRLTLLGGVDLRRPDGSRVQSLLAQPKRMALLAFMALEAPEGFVPRERIMSVLWPESDDARARQSLRNGLYQIRQSTDQGFLVNRGAAEVGVAGGLLTVDAVDFRKAVSEGRFADAVDLWGGSFLPGFHLDDNPEFEEWASRLRTALDGDALQAFREAASAQEELGKVEEARRLLRRAQEMAPADEQILRRRLLLLARQGNRATALAEGQEWIENLRSTLEMDPSEATLGLMKELQGGAVDAARGSVVVAPTQAKVESASGAAPTGALPPPRPWPGAERRGASPVGHGRRSAWRALTGWIVGPTVVLAVAWISASKPSPLPAESRGVIVERFTADAAAGGEAAGFALGALTARRLDAGGGGLVLPPDGVSAAALDGVERLLMSGRVRREGEKLMAELELSTTVRPDEILATASAEVDRFDLETLAVRLVADLERRSRRPLGATEVVPPLTEVPAAVVPYFEGEILAEAGRRGEARDAYQRAIEIDSAFAMAHFRLSMMLESLGLREDAVVSSDRAVALSPHMTVAERERLDAWRVYEWGMVEQALPLYESLAASRGPDRDVLVTVAEARFHWGPQLGLPRSSADSAFAALLAVAPADADALLHRLRLVAPADDTLAVDALFRRLSELEISDDVRIEAQALSDLSRRRPLAAEVAQWVLAGSFSLESRRLTQLAASARVPWDLADFVRALPPTEEPRRRVLRHLLVAQLAAASGRMGELSAELDALATRNPDRALEYRIALELASPIPPPADTLRVLRDRLRVVARSPGPLGPVMVDAAEPGIYAPRALVLDAMLTRRLGEPIDAPALMARGRATGQSFEPDYAGYIRQEVTASEYGAERLLGDMGAGRVEWHRIRPDPLSYLVALSRWSRARTLLTLGRDDAALRWLQTFPDVGGYDLAWVAESALLSARTLERGGRRAEAAAQYRRAAELWNGADPPFEPLLEEARAGLRRTGTARTY